jgi:hypothetical protein
MKRWYVCSMLASALLVARGVAQEPAQLASPDYYADGGTTSNANCPDGSLGGQGYGYGHHGQWHHGNYTYPPGSTTTATRRT